MGSYYFIYMCVCIFIYLCIYVCMYIHTYICNNILYIVASMLLAKPLCYELNLYATN